MKSQRLPITILDERYPGGEARLLAWDAWLEEREEGAKYLMADSIGAYIVHEVIRESRSDRRREQIRQLDAPAAAVLYREFRIRVANVFDMSGMDERLANSAHDCYT